LEILRFSEGEVNNSPLIRIHFAEDKCGSARAYSVCSKLGHRAELGFPGCTKAFDIANKPLALCQLASKGLVQEMLQCLQELAALSLQ
jgi:hypothetical protein